MRSRAPTVADSEAIRRVNALGLAWAVNTLAHSIVYPFIPLYLHDERRMAMATVGLVFPVMGVAKIVGVPVAGVLADWWGRGPVLLVGTLGRSLAFFALAAMAWYDAPFWAFALGLFCAAFLGTFFQNASHAYVTDLIVPDDHVLAFGRLRVGLNIGFMIGPAIGAFMAHTPFSLMFSATGILCALASVMCVRSCPLLPVRLDNESSRQGRMVGLATSFGTLAPMLALTLLLCLTVSQFFTTFTVYSTSAVGITRKSLGFLFTINGAMVIVMLMPLTKLLRRFNSFACIAFGSFLYVAAFAGIGMGRSWLALACATVVLTLGEMISMPSVTAAVSMRAPLGMTGRCMSMLGLAQEIGWALGPYLGAIAFERMVGHPLALWCLLASGAACAIPGFLAMAARGRR